MKNYPLSIHAKGRDRISQTSQDGTGVPSNSFSATIFFSGGGLESLTFTIICLFAFNRIYDDDEIYFAKLNFYFFRRSYLEEGKNQLTEGNRHDT